MGTYWQELRQQMVDRQLIPRGICNQRVLNAFCKVPRHQFISQEFKETNTYGDYPVSIGCGQTISQPYMVALMTEVLQLKGEERVLEVGTGSGYQAAILAELAREIYTIERIASLADQAKEVLSKLGYNNIRVKTGDGTLGWEEFSPYDAIIVTAGTPSVPRTLLKQLADKGRFVIPVGNVFSQMLTLITRDGERIIKSNICSCVFVPLIGKQGWKK